MKTIDELRRIKEQRRRFKNMMDNREFKLINENEL
jgi:hypothetical protein